MSQKSLCTQQSLTQDFQNLGVKPGSTLFLHSSLSSLGFVIGGAETIISALLETLGPKGTLVVPTHTSDNSDPSKWVNPPIPESWWPIIRDSTPAYDPLITRTSKSIGMIPETLRTWPGAIRSAHPQTSFAATGPNAVYITGSHALDSALAEESPLARMEELDAEILLLGVGYECCTAFHLAEYRVSSRETCENSFAIMVNEERVWVTVRDCRLDSSCFGRLGGEFEIAVPQGVRHGRVGDAHCRLISLRAAVKFATEWLRAPSKETSTASI